MGLEHIVVWGLVVVVILILLALLGPALTEFFTQVNNALEAGDVKYRTADELPPLCDHAKLHADSAEVWEYLNSANTRGCKWDCPDGRTRYFCKMPGGKWAFAVVEGAATVTAFFTSQEYGVGATRDAGCKNGMHPAGP